MNRLVRFLISLIFVSVAMYGHPMLAHNVMDANRSEDLCTVVSEALQDAGNERYEDKEEDDGTGIQGFLHATYDFTDLENVNDVWGASVALGSKNYILRNLVASYGVGLHMGFSRNGEYKSSSYTLFFPVNVGVSILDRNLEIATGPDFNIILSSKTKLENEVVYDFSEQEDAQRFHVSWGFSLRVMRMLKVGVSLSLQKGNVGRLSGLSVGFEF